MGIVAQVKYTAHCPKCGTEINDWSCCDSPRGDSWRGRPQGLMEKYDLQELTLSGGWCPKCHVGITCELKQVVGVEIVAIYVDGVEDAP